MVDAVTTQKLGQCAGFIYPLPRFDTHLAAENLWGGTPSRERSLEGIQALVTAFSEQLHAARSTFLGISPNRMEEIGRSIFILQLARFDAPDEHSTFVTANSGDCVDPQVLRDVAEARERSDKVKARLSECHPGPFLSKNSYVQAVKPLYEQEFDKELTDTLKPIRILVNAVRAAEVYSNAISTALSPLSEDWRKLATSVSTLSRQVQDYYHNALTDHSFEKLAPRSYKASFEMKSFRGGFEFAKLLVGVDRLFNRIREDLASTNWQIMVDVDDEGLVTSSHSSESRNEQSTVFSRERRTGQRDRRRARPEAIECLEILGLSHNDSSMHAVGLSKRFAQNLFTGLSTLPEGSLALFLREDTSFLRKPWADVELAISARRSLLLNAGKVHGLKLDDFTGFQALQDCLTREASRCRVAVDGPLLAQAEPLTKIRLLFEQADIPGLHPQVALDLLSLVFFDVTIPKMPTQAQIFPRYARALSILIGNDSATAKARDEVAATVQALEYNHVLTRKGAFGGLMFNEGLTDVINPQLYRAVKTFIDYQFGRDV